MTHPYIQSAALEAVSTGRAQSPGRSVRSPLLARVLKFMLVLGPGLIVMVADNDSGAVSTYSQAGGIYGLRLLWIIAILLPCTYFVQEMVARLGIATGSGLATLIVQRFGRAWGAFTAAQLQLVNFLTLVTEFAAITLASTAFGFPPTLAVPLAAAGLMAMVLSGSYRRWERATLVLCAFDLIWLALAISTGPGLGRVALATIHPGLPAGGLSGSLVFLIIAIVGTTIAPWQLFFQQACVADKRLRFADLKAERLETFIGALIVIGMAACMMIVADAARRAGFTFTDPAAMATFLGAHVGAWMRPAILLLMINAALLGSVTISLSSSWTYGEMRGWSHSLNVPFRDAPGFYLSYAAAIGLAAGLVLIPGAPLQLIILGVQVLAGLMLPIAIVFLQLLLNDRDVLGEHVNRPWQNAVNWTIVTILVALSFLLVAQVVAPGLFPA